MKIKAGSLLVLLGFFSCTSSSDGRYFATFDHFDSHGWKPEITITIDNNKIISARYDYKDRNENLKSRDQDYAEAMKKRSGTSPAEYVVLLEKRLLEKQELPIDAVTGASDSSEIFNELAEAILEKSKRGDKSDIVLNMNDSYKSEEKDFDADGYKAVLSVTFQNDTIVNARYDVMDKEGKSIKANTAYQNKYKSDYDINITEVIDTLEKELVMNQKIDRLSDIKGFTVHYSRFKNLLEDIYKIRN